MYLGEGEEGGWVYLGEGEGVGWEYLGDVGVLRSPTLQAEVGLIKKSI